METGKGGKRRRMGGREGGRGTGGKGNDNGKKAVTDTCNVIRCEGRMSL